MYKRDSIFKPLSASVLRDYFSFLIICLPNCNPGSCPQMLMMGTRSQISWYKSENVVLPFSLLLSRLTGRTTESIWLTPQVLHF